MEQQSSAPPEIRNLVNFLRSSKAGIKVRVGVLNGKRIDYFKGAYTIFIATTVTILCCITMTYDVWLTEHQLNHHIQADLLSKPSSPPPTLNFPKYPKSPQKKKPNNFSHPSSLMPSTSASNAGQAQALPHLHQNKSKSSSNRCSSPQNTTPGSMRVLN